MTARPDHQTFVQEIEESVLGCLLHLGGYQKVRGFLREDHFISPVHGEIYRLIGIAHERFNSTRMDVVFKLADEQFNAAMKANDQSAGPLMARMLASTITTLSSIEKDAQKVVEQWGRIQVMGHAEIAVEAARDPASSVQDVVRSTNSAFEEVMSDMRAFRGRRSRVSIAEAARGAIAACDAARRSGTGLTGLDWGWHDVNKNTGGIQKRDLTIIAARPSMGKTAIALGAALNASGRGSGVGFFSLEMDHERLSTRAISDLSFGRSCPLVYRDIIHGRLNDPEHAASVEIGRELDDYPLEIDDNPASVADIRVRLENMAEAFGREGIALEAIFIDYLGLIQSSSRYKGQRVNEIAETTGALKQIAKEYDIAVVLLSQLSRQVEGRENKRPMLADLRDSGAIEQDADTIIFLFREAYYLERERANTPEEDVERIARLKAVRHRLEFSIAKQRNGETPSIDLFCDMAYSAVRDLDRRYQ